MKQYQVPQFIDVEDRILGPVTMRQFFIMLIPFGLGILLYFLLKFWLMIIIIIPTTIISALFAFYKPYGMRFSRFFGAFLAYSIRPRMYIWKREEEAQIISANREDVVAPTNGSAVANRERRTTTTSIKDKRGSIETGSEYKE